MVLSIIILLFIWPLILIIRTFKAYIVVELRLRGINQKAVRAFQSLLVSQWFDGLASCHSG